MERFVRQMESMAGNGSLDIATYNPKQFVTTNAYRSLEGELIQKSGVKPVKTMRAQDFGGHLSVKFHVYEDGVTAMEYRKPGSKQVYYELVDEIPKEAIPSEKKPDDPLYLDIWNGFYKGAGEVVGDIIGTVAEIPKMAYMIGYKGALNSRIALSFPLPQKHTYTVVSTRGSTWPNICASPSKMRSNVMSSTEMPKLGQSFSLTASEPSEYPCLATKDSANLVHLRKLLPKSRKKAPEI
ncbi:hypothetical protein [Heyndrickxia coagulans]|uniref:Uncharacterized protein n=1 Tax=Heyndrickxia coagulans TaxID=1398 RepID=A0A150JTA2_HEYCO|nr:hypothetical protein [Heyndrickxia coagulans]KYC60499.1 hypothetical protein B4099_2253 [Heyndrickxia coagulans]